jgi:cysteinyl-tRNA synthetase
LRDERLALAAPYDNITFIHDSFIRTNMHMLWHCREALQQFSARQLRLMFLMAPWNKTVSYGETMRAEMKAREQAIKNFFQNVDVALREGDAKQAHAAAKWVVSWGGFCLLKE